MIHDMPTILVGQYSIITVLDFLKDTYIGSYCRIIMTPVDVYNRWICCIYSEMLLLFTTITVVITEHTVCIHWHSLTHIATTRSIMVSFHHQAKVIESLSDSFIRNPQNFVTVRRRFPSRTIRALKYRKTPRVIESHKSKWNNETWRKTFN